MCRNTVATNGTGITAGGAIEKRPPATEAQYFLKVEDKNKKPNT